MALTQNNSPDLQITHAKNINARVNRCDDTVSFASEQKTRAAIIRLTEAVRGRIKLILTVIHYFKRCSKQDFRKQQTVYWLTFCLIVAYKSDFTH